MQWYPMLKSVHMAAAYLTGLLFVLRLALDVAGRPGWRNTFMRWLPHLNDTVLLTAAIGLLFVTGWMPFVHHWLTAKVLLLAGYIIAGTFAIKPVYCVRIRLITGVLAIIQLMAIFTLAIARPAFLENDILCSKASICQMNVLQDRY